MRELTPAEKEQLEGKIKKEQERQQILRETNPELPKAFETAPAKTGLVRRFAPKRLWKYGFLGIILCLLAFNVFQFLTWRNFGSNKILNLNILVALMLLFTHIGFNFTKTGRKSRVMKTVACVWMVLVFVYIYISWVA
jgi:lipopolysaccharide export LptBFGC system permease protein LptF